MGIEHKPFFREGNGKCGVLFIHGILGTPNHFRDFLPLVPEDFTVCNILLDGHGKTVRDFSESSLAIWRRQADRAAERLCSRCERVIIVAHSMGTLFAIEQAIKRPDRVKSLFLLDVPLFPAVKPAAAFTAWKVLFDRIRADDPWGAAARDCFSMVPDRRLWLYLAWLPRYIELFAQMSIVRDLLPRLAVPTAAFQAGKDELVARRATLRLLRAQDSVTTRVLTRSGHFYIEKTDKEILLGAFQKALCGIMEQKNEGKA